SRYDVEVGQDSELQRPHEEGGRRDEVEERVDGERRDERRIGGPFDPMLDQVELEDVAAAGREDGVDGSPGCVRSEDAPPPHVRLRMRRREDVPTRAGADDAYAGWSAAA